MFKWKLIHVTYLHVPNPQIFSQVWWAYTSAAVHLPIWEQTSHVPLPREHVNSFLFCFKACWVKCLFCFCFKKHQFFMSFCWLIIFLRSIHYCFLKPDLSFSAGFAVTVKSAIWNGEGKELVQVFSGCLFCLSKKVSLHPFFSILSFLFPPPASPWKLETCEALSEHQIKSQEILTLSMTHCVCPWTICYYYRQKLCIALSWKIKSTVHDPRRLFANLNQSMAKMDRKERLQKMNTGGVVCEPHKLSVKGDGSQ